MPRIKQKFIITANLTNKTAFSISSGDGEFMDSVVVKDANENPFIPATSLIGVIRSEFKKYDKNLASTLLGDSDNPSQLMLSDAKLISKAQINIRNGIKVSNITGITQEGALYDYEVVGSGARFSFKAEVTIRKSHNKDDMLRAIDIFYSILKNGLFIGAKSMNGLGEIKFSDIKVSRYDFSQNGAFESFLDKKELDNYKPNLVNKVKKEDESEDIRFCLNLDIKNSLLIGSTSTQSDSDIGSLCENGEFLASGTSLKGAIRNRALKIAKFLGADESFIDDLFGYVDEKSKKAKKSKIKIKESIINKAISKSHQRIKIDRFSGSTMDGALFDSEPIFKGDLRLDVLISNPDEKEIGLILLVLKDLATGKLAVGGGKNVGRGVFEISKGNDSDKNASFEAYNGNFKIYQKDKTYSKDDLNKFVANLGEKLW